MLSSWSGRWAAEEQWEISVHVCERYHWLACNKIFCPVFRSVQSPATTPVWWSCLCTTDTIISIEVPQMTLDTEKYVCSAKECCNRVTLVACTDESHTKHSSQLCYIVELFYCYIKKCYVTNFLPCAWQKSRNLVLCKAAVYIISAREAIDKIFYMQDKLSYLLDVKVHPAVQIDFKDLYGPLSS